MTNRRDFEYRPRQAITLAMAIFLVVMLIDNFVEQEVEREHYCEMVRLWESESHLPVSDRSGWPPFDGKCIEEK